MHPRGLRPHAQPIISSDCGMMSAQPQRPTARTTHTPDRRYAFELSEAGLLGSGAHGVVRAARHVETGELVAVKVMPASVLAHIAKELIAQAKMHHPNIVQLHTTQVDLDRKRVYMVMELCRGGELFDRIAECGRLDEQTARAYLVQMADAIAHCHAKSVYHRDLKPENILLDEHNVVKIADFGLAALAHQVREDASFLQHTKCGSLMYAAPEVLTSNEMSGYDAAKADVWSLGIILYSMLSGALPFRMAMASKCQRYAIVQQRGVRILCEANGFTPDATDLLCAMLDPNPSHRISAAQILRSPWCAAHGSDLDLGLTKWSVVLGDKPGEVQLPAQITAAATAAGDAAIQAARRAEEVQKENAAREAAARVAMGRMEPQTTGGSGGSPMQEIASEIASDRKRTAQENAADEGRSGKRLAVAPPPAAHAVGRGGVSSSGGGAPSAAGAPSGAAPVPVTQPSGSDPQPSPIRMGETTFFKHPLFDDAPEEIPSGVNGMLVRSLGWVQLPEEKERMVGDVASALDALGVRYQVVKGELSDVVWVGQPSTMDSEGVPELSYGVSDGISRRDSNDSHTSMGTACGAAAVGSAPANPGGGSGGGGGAEASAMAIASTRSHAMSVDGGSSTPPGGIPRRESMESAVGGEPSPGIVPNSPGAYSQGQLCVRLRIQHGPDSESSNLHISRHSGDVLQFHSFYRDVRNQLAGVNGWVNQNGRYEHTVPGATEDL